MRAQWPMAAAMARLRRRQHCAQLGSKQHFQHFRHMLDLEGHRPSTSALRSYGAPLSLPSASERPSLRGQWNHQVGPCQ
eukprot:NODE_20500_length_795_cov_5.291916.p3 GENE.NODE_20500_length_795_cov_5.291916~~NODE_20500_length_795_cov_5.291916.p3  ORF type:complete len:79 (+),score=7.49 NODE_20500_length_795_cov_5.291916:546-782(+)